MVFLFQQSLPKTNKKIALIIAENTNFTQIFIMEIFLTAEAWISLLTLTLLEIILGVDNIIFISVVSNSLPKQQQGPAQRIGLVIAMVFRVGLLVLLVYLMQKLNQPLFYVFETGFSLRDIILFGGGLFLLAKSTSEIHAKMESSGAHESSASGNKFSKVIIQIVLLNIVFSFDSILTAIGLSNVIIIMILAVIISMFIMMAFAGKISRFISSHPTLEILALSFLILIGFMLVIDAFHIEVPKGYIYFALFFSLIVELINMRVRKNSEKKKLKKQI